MDYVYGSKSDSRCLLSYLDLDRIFDFNLAGYFVMVGEMFMP